MSPQMTLKAMPVEDDLSCESEGETHLQNERIILRRILADIFKKNGKFSHCSESDDNLEDLIKKEREDPLKDLEEGIFIFRT